MINVPRLVRAHTGGLTALLLYLPLSGCSRTEAPRDLFYSPDVLEMRQGGHGRSAVPTVNDGGKPPHYSIKMPPAGIGIEKDTGVVFVDPTVSAGIYELEVSAANKGGETVFSGAITIRVLRRFTAPEAVRYEEKWVSLLSGVRYDSGPAVVDGRRGTLSFELRGAGAGYSIDGETGELSIQPDIRPGSYEISVTVSNGAG